MPTHINLQQLRAFYLTARHGSMTLAAGKLYVSRPAVTMHIRNLEHWLGMKLFRRSKGGLTLTEQGKKLYSRSESIFQHVEALEQYIGNVQSRQQKELVLGTHHILAQFFLPSILSHVRNTCPKLRVEIVLGVKGVFFEKILSQQIHAAIIVGDYPKERLAAKPLFNEELPLVTASAGALGSRRSISVKELAGIQLVLQQKDTGIQEAVQAFLTRHKATPSVIMENISSDIIKNVLLQEPGAASFVPRFAVQHELEAGTLREIQVIEDAPVISFSFVFLNQQPLPPVIKSFMDCLTTFTFPQRN